MAVDTTAPERRSAELPGLAALASLGLLAWAAPRLGLVANDPVASPLYLAATLALVALAAAVVSIVALVRRRGYHWLAAAAALALVAFDPGKYPTGVTWGLGHRGPGWRIFWVTYVFTLLTVAVVVVARMVRKTDELEQRVSLHGLALAFGLTLAVALAWALLEDVLPPLRAAHVVALMAAGWIGGTAIAVRRYR